MPRLRRLSFLAGYADAETIVLRIAKHLRLRHDRRRPSRSEEDEDTTGMSDKLVAALEDLLLLLRNEQLACSIEELLWEGWEVGGGILPMRKHTSMGFARKWMIRMMGGFEVYHD